MSADQIRPGVCWPKSPRMATCSSSDMVLNSATEALQAQERFLLRLKDSMKANDTIVTTQVIKNAASVLDNLRDIKSNIEGTAANTEGLMVNEDILQELKQLTLMHVTSSLTEHVKQQFQQLLLKMFEGSCEKILFASLVTNYWYMSTQEDRGLQAKNNNIFIVYLCKDYQYFNPLVKEQHDIIDKAWFYATEVGHFAHYLVKGKARFVETLFNEESVLYKDPDWDIINDVINKQDVTGQRGFIEQCRGQAVGAVAKKRKSGKIGAKDAATLYEFCESFQLLHQVDQVLSGETLTLRIPAINGDGTLSELALKQLRDTYQTEDFSKSDLLKTILGWKEVIDDKVKRFKFSSSADIEWQVGSWLAKVRKTPDFEPISLEYNPNEREKLFELQKRIGGNVSNMAPEQVVMIAQAGSYMYGLNTPQSDTDYVVIYTEPTQVIISACKSLKECFEDRGPNKSFEYGAYEVRLFCEMVLKGSVVMLELLFADDLEYCSPAWKALTADKHLFLTEKGILQYFGLIKNNMMLLNSGKHRSTPREGKLFYQIFYKLHTLEYFLKGQTPSIKCSGAMKDFIMQIRKGPLEGDICYEKLYCLAEEKILDMKQRLANRKERLAENVSHDFMTKWLMCVRGWNKVNLPR